MAKGKGITLYKGVGGGPWSKGGGKDVQKQFSAFSEKLVKGNIICPNRRKLREEEIIYLKIKDSTAYLIEEFVIYEPNMSSYE